MSFLWILEEQNLETQNEYVVSDGNMLLGDTVPDICKIVNETEESYTIREGDLFFFQRDSRLSRGMKLKDIETSYEYPLVVGYRKSKKKIRIRVNHDGRNITHAYKHDTSLWTLLNKNVCRIWSSLVGEKYVLVWQKGTEDEEEITDSFQLNILLDRLLAGEDTQLIKLHVLSPRKQSYSKWETEEALREILQIGSINELESFQIEKCDSNKAVSEKAFECFMEEITRKKETFVDVNINEATREYISPFLTTAVSHVNQKSKSKRLQLHAEQRLNGSRGYGPIDYTISLDKSVIVVHEVKKGDLEKGLGQNIVQLHTACEVRSKRRKTDQMKTPLYGILSDGEEWYFLQWSGCVKNPIVKVFIAKCNLHSKDFEGIGDVLDYIISLLFDSINESESITKDSPESKVTKTE